VHPQDPVKELEDFLSSLPSWQRKYLESESPTEAELSEYVAASGTSVQMFDQDTIRRKYETLLQKVPTRWREYVRRKKKLASSFVPKGKPGRPPDHQTLERVLQLKSQRKSLREIAILLGAQPDQIPGAIDRIRKLIASARKRSKRGTNPS
jgi:hypothetical protein